MNISEILKLECCSPAETASSKKQALEIMAELLSRAPELKDTGNAAILDALRKREQMGSTGFGKGIAIPHCQIEGLEHFVVNIVRFPHGVDFDAVDQKKVKLCVCIVGPATDRAGHLQLLAKVSRTLKEPDALENMLHQTTRIGLYEEFLRNAQNGDFVVSKKTKEKLMILVVKDDEIMEDITEVFLELGIQESMIVETQQMDSLLSDVPLFLGFFNFTGGRNTATKLVLVHITRDYINAIIKSLEDTFGDLDEFAALSVMVLDVFYSKGL